MLDAPCRWGYGDAGPVADLEETLAFQQAIRSRDGIQVDPEIVSELAYRWQVRARYECPRRDEPPNLVCDLCVDRIIEVPVDGYCHLHVDIVYCLVYRCQALKIKMQTVE